MEETMMLAWSAWYFLKTFFAVVESPLATGARFLRCFFMTHRENRGQQ